MEIIKKIVKVPKETKCHTCHFTTENHALAKINLSYYGLGKSILCTGAIAGMISILQENLEALRKEENSED